MCDAVSSVNSLESSCAGTQLRPSRVGESSSLSLCQETAYREIRRRISHYDEKPSDLSGRGALQELLKTTDVYSTDVPTTVAAFEVDKVRVLKGDLFPHGIETVAPAPYR